MPSEVSPGIYNIEYFSGAQTAIYIGDYWIDEITSMSFQVSQSRVPLYGYADPLFRAVAKGQVLVEGQFTINFKEAGYIWLALNHLKNREGKETPFFGGKGAKSEIERRNLERMVDGETNTFERNELLTNLAAWASLTGFASTQRAVGTSGQEGGFGPAETEFENYENLLWKAGNNELDEMARRADDPRLQGFDIYVAFGDFAGDDRHNHTIQKITDVHIIGSGKTIQIDGCPIQEQYQFIGRNLV